MRNTYLHGEFLPALYSRPQITIKILPLGLFTLTFIHFELRFGLSTATSIMFWMLVRKPPSDIARRIRRNNEW